MKRLLTVIFLFSVLSTQAQMMSEEFYHLKKYMGVTVLGGYEQLDFKHASLNRFAQSYNTFFGPMLESQLTIPNQINGPVVGIEINAAMFRLGYMRRFISPMLFEARHTDGSVRKMELSAPNNMGYLDILMPIAKGKVFLGMAIGLDYGRYELRSYLLHNFGRATYANDDGLSGIYRPKMNLHGRLGARLEINPIKRLSINARVELYNKVIGGNDTPLVGWEDSFYYHTTLRKPRYSRVYMAEDVVHRNDEFIYLGNTRWETDPAIHGSPKGMIYTLTAHFQILSFYKK